MQQQQQQHVRVRRHVLALDLVDDPAAIAAYEAAHRAVPAEVEAQIRAAGVVGCSIHRVMNRLVMLLDVDEARFSWEAKAAADAAHGPTVAWEAAMGELQRALPCALPGQKWVLLDQIYSLPQQHP